MTQLHATFSIPRQIVRSQFSSASSLEALAEFHLKNSRAGKKAWGERQDSYSVQDKEPTRQRYK